MPTKEQRGIRPSAPALRAPPRSKRRRGSSAPPPLSAPQNRRQYAGAAVLRRNTFPNYQLARTVRKPQGTAKKALHLLKTDPDKLLQPKHSEEFKHIILPGGILEPRISRNPKLVKERKRLLDLSSGPEHHDLWGSVGNMLEATGHSAWHSIKHPVNTKALHQFGQEAKAIYLSSTGKKLTKKEAKTLKESGFNYSAGGILKPPQDLTRVAIGVGPGLVYHGIRTYHDPIGAQIEFGRAIGRSYKETAQHPLRQYNRPGGAAEVLFNVAGPFFAGARLAKGFQQVNAATALSKAATSKKIALYEEKGYPVEVLRKMDQGMPLRQAVGQRSGKGVVKAAIGKPKAKREITYRGKSVHPAAYKSGLGQYVQQFGDYLLQKQLDNPDNMVANFLKQHGGRLHEVYAPEARFGRMARRESDIRGQVRGGMAIYIRGAKRGPSLPARLHNVFAQEDIPAIRQSKRGVRMTHDVQASKEGQAADIVASSRGYTMHEMHHDLWDMGHPGDWWTIQSHTFQDGGLIAVRGPKKDFAINPDKFRSESQLAEYFKNMFPTREQVKANPEKYRFVPTPVVEGLHPYGAEVGSGVVKHATGGAVEKLASRVDTFTQGIRAGRFIHPGYAQNMVQNRVFHLSQAGMYAFRNAYLFRHVYPKLWKADPAFEGWLEEAAGAGHAMAQAGEKSHLPRTQLGKVDLMLEKLRSKGEKFWHEIDDRPVRMQMLMHEFASAGLSPQDVQALFHRAVEQNDKRAWAELQPLIQRGRKEAIDYGEMTPAERALLRRMFTAYGWTRGATTFSGRYPFQHPVQAQVAQQMGQEGADRVDEIFSKVGGMIPEWLEGTLPITGGNSPLAVETSWLPPFETPARMARAVPGLGTGLEPLSGEIAPGPSLLTELVTGRNRYGQQLYGTERLKVPVGETLRRFRPFGAITPLLNPKPTSTVVGGKRTALFRFLGVPVEKIRDLEKTGQMGIRDFRESLPPDKRIDFDHDYKMSQIPHEVSLLRKRFDVPDALVGQYKGDLDANREMEKFQLKWAKKHDARGYDRMKPKLKVEGVIKFLHTHNYFDEADARSARVAATAMTDDKQLTSYANQLWNVTGIGETISSWKELLKAVKPGKVTK